MAMYSHCMFIYDYPDWGLPCFFLSCKANARVKPAKTGHGPHSSQFLCCSMYFLCCSMYFCVVLCIVCFVTYSVLFVCICVLNYSHRVATQLQLNISYHTISYLTTALHVSGVAITHIQEHKSTVTTASGNRYTVIDRVKFTDKEYR